MALREWRERYVKLRFRRMPLELLIDWAQLQGRSSDILITKVA